MAGTASLAQGYAPPNSFGSAVVNGQLVGFPTKSGYYPLNYGGGLSAVPSASPLTIPPSVGYGLGTVPTGSTSANSGSSGSGSFTGSVAMWAIGAMIFGLVWLRFVHWRKPKAAPPSED
jgi:hypothetical protein